MSDENKLILKQSKYKSLNQILNLQEEHEGKPYLNKILEKTHKLSQFIKKIKLVEDPKFYQSANKDYANILKICQNKIEKIIFKTLVFCNPETLNSNIKDVKEYTIIINLVSIL